jgi:hypothetical protein
MISGEIKTDQSNFNYGRVINKVAQSLRITPAELLKKAVEDFKRKELTRGSRRPNGADPECEIGMHD